MSYTKGRADHAESVAPYGAQDGKSAIFETLAPQILDFSDESLYIE